MSTDGPPLPGGPSAYRELEVFYDDCPPSLNAIGTRGSHWAVTKAKKQWQATIETLLMASALPRSTALRIRVDALLRYPQRRRRDEGNLRWLLEKACGDALTLSRGRGEPPVPDSLKWLADDDAEHFRFGHVCIDPERGPRRTTLRIRWWPR